MVYHYLFIKFSYRYRFLKSACFFDACIWSICIKKVCAYIQIFEHLILKLKILHAFISACDFRITYLLELFRSRTVPVQILETAQKLLDRN